MFAWKNKLRAPFGNISSPDEDEVAEREAPDESDIEADAKVAHNLITKTVSMEDIEKLADDSDKPQGKSPEVSENALTQPATLEEAAPAEVKAVDDIFGSTGKEGGEPEQEEESDSLSDLFSDDEEEENPLAGLITSMPDVAAKELIEDIKEVQVLLHEWQEG